MSQPRILRAGIGGFLGPSYSVEWTGSELIYEAHESGERTAWVKTTPTDAQWTRFWKRCTKLGVWEWQRTYEPDSLVTDGTGWHVDIEGPHGRVHSSGTNACPPTGEMETKEFKTFCRALSSLIGGTPFH